MKYYDILKLLEAKQVGVLYHYTSIENALQIITDNTLQENEEYVSFTRDKNFHAFSRKEEITGTACQFVIDGDKLSTKYKIEPFNYFKRNKTQINIDDEYAYNHTPYVDEQEERVKGSILKLRSYLIKIRIDKNDFYIWKEYTGEEDDEYFWLRRDAKKFLDEFNKYCLTEWM